MEGGETGLFIGAHVARHAKLGGRHEPDAIHREAGVIEGQKSVGADFHLSVRVGPEGHGGGGMERE